MKKYYKITFLLILIALPSIALFAQDAQTGVGVDDFSFLLKFIPKRFQAVSFTVITLLFFMEQFLAATSKIKANSTFQLVANWIGSMYKAVRKDK
jgi:hypothetical protein